MLDVVLITITFITLLIASYTDLKTREVPDWVSYGLILAAFGVRIIFMDFNAIISGILGFGVALAVAFVFYYAGQWGGGDSKLLMGIGAVIGISYPFNVASLDLLWYFMGLLFLGAIYGLFWMAYLAVINRKEFKSTFRKKVEDYKWVHYSALGCSLLLLITAFLVPIIWLFVIIPIALFYLLISVSTVEEKCFVKSISTSELTEGDWLAKDVVVDKKVIVRKKTLHAKDIEKLWKLKSVMIKEGIPFVPSFLFAYVFLIFGKGVMRWFVGFLF